MAGKKPTIYWCMKSGEYLRPSWLGCGRRDTIDNFVKECGNDWEHWKKRGWTCVKVIVSEVVQS